MSFTEKITMELESIYEGDYKPIKPTPEQIKAFQVVNDYAQETSKLAYEIYCTFEDCKYF